MTLIFELGKVSSWLFFPGGPGGGGEVSWPGGFESLGSKALRVTRA